MLLQRTSARVQSALAQEEARFQEHRLVLTEVRSLVLLMTAFLLSIIDTHCRYAPLLCALSMWVRMYVF